MEPVTIKIGISAICAKVHRCLYPLVLFRYPKTYRRRFELIVPSQLVDTNHLLACATSRGKTRHWWVGPSGCRHNCSIISSRANLLQQTVRSAAMGMRRKRALLVPSAPRPTVRMWPWSSLSPHHRPRDRCRGLVRDVRPSRRLLPRVGRARGSKNPTSVWEDRCRGVADLDAGEGENVLFHRPKLCVKFLVAIVFGSVLLLVCTLRYVPTQ